MVVRLDNRCYTALWLHDRSVEPDAAPSFCPYPYNAGWHQGIDIELNSGTTIYAQVTGTVAASVTSCLSSTCGLGYLAIRETSSGRIIYLLHGSPTASYTQVGTPVAIGSPVYTTGTNGLSTGPHLHFEVHNSVVGELSVPVGPGDDIDPESWLVRPARAITSTCNTGGDYFLDIYGGIHLTSIAPLRYFRIVRRDTR